jgi:hypothetical protein
MFWLAFLACIYLVPAIVCGAYFLFRGSTRIRRSWNQAYTTQTYPGLPSFLPAARQTSSSEADKDLATMLNDIIRDAEAIRAQSYNPRRGDWCVVLGESMYQAVVCDDEDPECVWTAPLNKRGVVLPHFRKRTKSSLTLIGSGLVWNKSN